MRKGNEVDETKIERGKIKREKGRKEVLTKENKNEMEFGKIEI
jgi:hypothetical protein